MNKGILCVKLVTGIKFISWCTVGRTSTYQTTYYHNLEYYNLNFYDH